MTRNVLLGIGLALALMGCASGASSVPPGSVAPASVSPSDGTAPSVEPPASEAACRMVTHALGETCIPSDPQRVVTLGCVTSLEYALALDLPLIGYDISPVGPPVPTYLDPALLEGATPLGSCFEPDLELVKPLDPDLIIYAFDAGNYPQASAIAPTVVLQVGYLDYRDDFKAAAEMLGRTEQADAFLAELDSSLAAASARLAPRLEGKTVSAFETTTDGKANIHPTGDYIGSVLADLGIERPEAQHGPDRFEISLEQIGLLDADVALAAFGFTDPESEAATEATRKQFVENPLWATLKFVQDDELHLVDKEIWGLYGIYWAKALAENIESVLLP